MCWVLEPLFHSYLPLKIFAKLPSMRLGSSFRGTYTLSSEACRVCGVAGISAATTAVVIVGGVAGDHSTRMG